MKLFIFLTLIHMLLASCSITVSQHKAPCDATKEELQSLISVTLLKKNFQIKVSDSKLGYIYAESDAPAMQSIWTGPVKRVWQFQVGDTVFATAKTIITGSEYYYDGSASKDWDWYWDVRNAVEQLCGYKFKVIKFKTK